MLDFEIVLKSHLIALAGFTWNLILWWYKSCDYQSVKIHRKVHLCSCIASRTFSYNFKSLSQILKGVRGFIVSVIWKILGCNIFHLSLGTFTLFLLSRQKCKYERRNKQSKCFRLIVFYFMSTLYILFFFVPPST